MSIPCAYLSLYLWFFSRLCTSCWRKTFKRATSPLLWLWYWVVLVSNYGFFKSNIAFFLIYLVSQSLYNVAWFMISLLSFFYISVEYDASIPCVFKWCLFNGNILVLFERFIIGFFLAAIPWYVGAFLLLCARVDYREKPGLVTCTIAVSKNFPLVSVYSFLGCILTVYLYLLVSSSFLKFRYMLEAVYFYSCHYFFKGRLDFHFSST